MSGFISSPALPVDPVDATVVMDGWFPDIRVADIRSKVRMGEGVVSHERLLGAIEGAALTALKMLSKWRSAIAATGIARLEDIDDISIGGKSRPVIIWERIIRYYTAAEIADLYRDISATIEGRDRADEEDISADGYRRLAHNAVTDLLSIGAETPVQRNMVDLV
ncbi:head completion/stabilization protein [Parasphingorhabdus sp. JC815]|uniref:head completion/stabilization protein n=1 Tax=Parasphingorhabdus sp. JC815 TaxID=3232140 RepID=UPI003458DBF2